VKKPSFSSKNQVKSYMKTKLFPLFLLFFIATSCGKEKQINDRNEKLNMLLVANVSDADAFKKLSIDVNYPKFKNWCDASKFVYSKVNDTTVIELFFDIDKVKLQEFLNDPEVIENISRFNFKPVRYSFETYIDWPTSSAIK
jgi:hypothetical protein